MINKLYYGYFKIFSPLYVINISSMKILIRIPLYVYLKGIYNIFHHLWEPLEILQEKKNKFFFIFRFVFQINLHAKCAPLLLNRATTWWHWINVSGAHDGLGFCRSHLLRLQILPVVSRCFLCLCVVCGVWELFCVSVSLGVAIPSCLCCTE